MIKFRIAVYNASGQYDSSYVYSVNAGGTVTPDSGNPIKLNGGQSYTFIAYSYNTNVAPVENLIGSNLNTVNISTTSQDFMYYKTTMTPNGETNAQNNLNIVLKHSFSTITLNIDSSLTNGYNITNIGTVTLGKVYPNASVNLNTGAIISFGTAGTIGIPFPANPLDTNNLVSTAAVIVNNASNLSNAIVNISSLTIGPLTQTGISFNGLTIRPGVRYNMILQLTPQDTFIDDTTSAPGTTIKAARINGKVWMRYNLGVDTSVNPNPDFTNPVNGNLFGNYYQWGRSGTLANGNSGPGAINDWDNTAVPPANSWNTGTETTPIRTTNDPCPENYRVPTITEFQDLINSTTQSNVNDSSWDNGSATNYTSIKVFTSKRDKNIILSFPATGFRDYVNGALSNASLRGTIGIYWASSTPTFSPSNYKNMQLYKSTISTTSGAYNQNFGENIRCIRTY
ncbi:hypothetical protein M2T92_10485 [Elizabethkingia miricola]|nr:FISUMP domain-containing protein [Elizabethkingia miricola]MCL1679451.1 hypothetical protein [Elizabethkingia miricola]